MANSKKFPLYLPYNDHIYCIKGFIDDFDEYIDGKAYVERKSNKVYLYTEEKLPIPRFYMKNGELEFKEPSVNNDKFLLEQAYSLSTEVILGETNGDEVLYDEQALMDMNSATSTFVPIICEGDDCLKRLVKHAIRGMHINIHMLKSYIGQKYAISNLKAALTGRTKMTIPNFNIWCELLGLDYEIKLIPRDCKRLPVHLQEPLIYSSYTDSISGIHEDDIEESAEDETEDCADIEEAESFEEE